MTFEEILDQAAAMLQRRGRVTYRTLKREFGLDDDALADLKDELLFSGPQVQEEDGRGLVWAGGNTEGETAKRGNGETAVPSAQLPVAGATVDCPDPRLAQNVRVRSVVGETRGQLAVGAAARGARHGTGSEYVGGQPFARDRA